MKHLDKIIKILTIIFTIFVFYYILFGSIATLNSDSSFLVDYSLEQIRTHSIFPKGWINTSDFWVYSLIPIITPLIKLGFTLFRARQISVVIQTILIIYILKILFDNYIKCKKGFRLTMLIFLSGISGTFMLELYGDATYATIILAMLLTLLLFIKYLHQI